MATIQATIAGLQNDAQYGVRVYPRCSKGWQTAPDAQGFCTPMAFSPILSENSWAQIDAASRAGIASVLWKVGAEKDITLTTGERLTLQIYGFAHDDLTSGGKAGITFGLKNLMAKKRRMNNAGDPLIGSFTGNALYLWLQGALYGSLPTDLKTVIKSANKKTSAGDYSSTINTNAMRIFLFSEIECLGYVVKSRVGEGAMYPIFSNSANLTKWLSNGAEAACYWWERSPHKEEVGTFCVIAGGGTGAASGPSGEYGICFGFCV